MWGRRYFGAAYFGPRYWGSGSEGVPISFIAGNAEVFRVGERGTAWHVRARSTAWQIKRKRRAP